MPHTPGTWNSHMYDNKTIEVNVNLKKGVTRYICSIERAHEDTDAKDNAALICAAPELLYRARS